MRVFEDMARARVRKVMLGSGGGLVLCHWGAVTVVCIVVFTQGCKVFSGIEMELKRYRMGVERGGSSRDGSQWDKGCIAERELGSG